MRGFVIGLAVVAFVSVTVLSIRPGGLRRQLRFAARRFRLAIILGGIYVVAATVARIVFPDGGVIADWGLPVLALALLVIFLVLGQNPEAPGGQASTRS